MSVHGVGEEIHTIWGTSSNDVFAIGPGSRSSAVFHFDGDNWKELELTEDLYVYKGVWGIPGRYFFLKTDWRSAVIITEYDGSNWSDIDTGVIGWPMDIWGSSTSDIFVVGYDKETIPDGVKSRILHFDGDNWTEMENDFTVALLSVWGNSSTDVYAVGSDTILHYDGNSWSVMETNLHYSLRSIWGASKDCVYAAGGSVLHYDGIKWTEVSDRGTGDVWVSPDGEVFVTGGGGPASYSDGKNWINLCAISHNFGKDTTKYYSGVWGTSRNDVFVVGSKCKPVWYCQGIILRSNFKDDLNCFCE